MSFNQAKLSYPANTGLPSNYTIEDLNLWEDKIKTIAKSIGIEVPDIIFHFVQSEEMYDVAARGLPGRYSHWWFGQSYAQQKSSYDQGMSRIYELVINTLPPHAYLLDGNSIISQLMVMSHVYGHTYFFLKNKYFDYTDRKILPRVSHAAERIEAYMSQYGRDLVEDWIDHAEALAWHLPYDQVKTKGVEPSLQKDQFDDLFPEEVSANNKKLSQEYFQINSRFPRHPERDVLGFISKHSKYLSDWQRDILSIIRTETEYFVPQTRTQVMNEGFACLAHLHIMHELHLPTEAFTEFQALTAGVVSPRMGHPSPYSLGLVMWQEIARMCVAPSKEEKEKWDWAGKITNEWEKIFEIVEGYDDASFIGEFLTPAVCEKAKLFAWDTETKSNKKQIVVSTHECEEIKARLVKQHTNRGLPVIEIVNADGNRGGELWLEHRFEDVGLDPEYALQTTQHLAWLWGTKVVVTSINNKNETISYECLPGKRAGQVKQEIKK